MQSGLKILRWVSQSDSTIGRATALHMTDLSLIPASQSLTVISESRVSVSRMAQKPNKKELEIGQNTQKNWGKPLLLSFD